MHYSSAYAYARFLAGVSNYRRLLFRCVNSNLSVSDSLDVIQIFFIESICDDEAIITNNILVSA